METTADKGVYFIADDKVIDLCIAFLSSFRTFNKDIPLCLIPYNNDYTTLESLKEEYDFFIFPDKDLLERCDDVSLYLHPYRFGHYRKLAIWEGPFKEFIYIDIDTVVLDNIRFVFDFLKDHDFITATSDIPHALKWVWHASVFQSGILTEEQIRYAANTGFIASHRGALSLREATGKAAGVTELLPHMNLYCYEQPFLNYLIVTSGRRYTSLQLLKKKHDWISTERWAGEKGGYVRNGIIQFRDKENKVLFLHWAGEWQVYEKERRLIKLLQAIRLLPRDKFPAISYTMPYKKLWKHYRFMHHD